MLLPIEAQVVELLVYQQYLSVGQRKCLAIDQVLDRLQLFDDERLSGVDSAPEVPLRIFDLIEVPFEDLFVQGIASALLRPQIQNSTTDLKQILGHILALAFDVASLGVNVEALLGLMQQGRDLHALLLELPLADEVQLVEDIDEVDLIRLLNLRLQHLTELIVELFDKVSIALLIDVLEHPLIGISHSLLFGLE